MQISAQPLAYSDLDTPLTGMLYRNEAIPGARPGILLIHGGAGLDEHAREQARRYAALGYVVLACDMYGDGVAGDRDRVIGCATALRDNPALMARPAQAGLAALSRGPAARPPPVHRHQRLARGDTRRGYEHLAPHPRLRPEA